MSDEKSGEVDEEMIASRDALTARYGAAPDDVAAMAESGDEYDPEGGAGDDRAGSQSGGPQRCRAVRVAGVVGSGGSRNARRGGRGAGDDRFLSLAVRTTTERMRTHSSSKPLGSRSRKSVCRHTLMRGLWGDT